MSQENQPGAVTPRRNLLRESHAATAERLDISSEERRKVGLSCYFYYGSGIDYPVSKVNTKNGWKNVHSADKYRRLCLKGTCGATVAIGPRCLIKQQGADFKTNLPLQICSIVPALSIAIHLQCISL